MSSSREVTAQKKKDVWEEAGGEFYQESYPSGSKAANSTHRRRPSRLAIPLPSHTARRGSILQGRYHKSGGRRKIGNNTGARAGLTYTSTMGAADANGTTTNANDIQVSILPDLSEETILNERKTWEELLRIKSMPVPMAQKKQLKAQLTNLPKLRLKGWRHLKFTLNRHWKHVTAKLTRINRHFVFLNRSIRTVELRRGTAIANVFLFIKWTMFLNIIVSLAMMSFVIGPYTTYEIIRDKDNEQNATCSNSSQGPHLNLSNSETLNEFLGCCRALYDQEKINRSSIEGLHGELTTFLKSIHLGDFEYWPIHFRFYHEPIISYDQFTTKYAFAAAYVLSGAIILLCSLILLVHNISGGVREIIRLKEGEFYKYSNLIFSGWDHFTGDETGANFKRSLIRNEMKTALLTEKKKITDLGKTRKAKLKLLMLRIFVNVTVVGLLISAGLIIFHMSLNLTKLAQAKRTPQNSSENGNETVAKDQNSEEDFDIGDLLKEFSISIVISFFNLIFPIILSRLGKLEDLSKEWEIALVLLRSLFIRLFSIYALAAVFYKYTYCVPKPGYCTECDTNRTFEDSGNIQLENSNGNSGIKDRVRCWEGEFAAQIYKLVFTELVLKIIITFVGDPLRRFVRYCFKNNNFARRIGTLSFNIVRHSLDIIYIQLLAWISFYFAPFMPILTVLYCLVIFHVKKFGVLYNVNYTPDTFRTSRTTAVFMMAKVISFSVVLFTFSFIVGYMTPSRECGPFRGKETAWVAVKDQFEHYPWMRTVVDAAFPGVAVPLALVLMLLTYYYYSVAQANRAMVETLRHLLILEGHDKQYLFAKLNSLRRKSQSNSPTTEDGETLHQP